MRVPAVSMLPSSLLPADMIVVQRVLEEFHLCRLSVILASVLFVLLPHGLSLFVWEAFVILAKFTLQGSCLPACLVK